jgi:hypothetical protein
MLDPIIQFVQSIFSAIGRGVGIIIAWILFPFLSASRWYASRGLILKAIVGLILLFLVVIYAHFIWQTQVWSTFNPDFISSYKLDQRKLAAGADVPNADTAAPKKCQSSAIVTVAADLIDFEVNQNTWISSMPTYKAGFFGLDWDRNLQDARQNMQYDEESWYISFSPFGFRTPTQNVYRQAITELRDFNKELESCAAIFDGRTDNLLQFLDRISNDLGSTSAMLKERSENHNAGWFDTRADDRFWFAYGQMYGYYAILTATRADFLPVITEKNLGALWKQMLERFRATLRIQPAIISNGREDGWIMPNHLSTQGFYLLNARNNLVDIRDVLDR